jgi:hypothetical protein
LSLQKKYVEIFSLLAPVGAVGVPLVFGSATVARESEEAVPIERPAIPLEGVSERLAAIREAVSAVAKLTQPCLCTVLHKCPQRHFNKGLIGRIISIITLIILNRGATDGAIAISTESVRGVRYSLFVVWCAEVAQTGDRQCQRSSYL